MTPQAPPEHNTVATTAALPRFIQCRNPAALYEGMRQHGLQTRRSINSIVLEAVAAYRAEVDAHGGAPGHAPLAGGRQVTYNIRLDDDLYNWLRTTAFHARTSINALIIAALTRAHANEQERTIAV